MKVCFIGHRKIDTTEKLKNTIMEMIEKLIGGGADTFLFGSRSKFDSLCWEVVTELQARFTNIRRTCYLVPGETVFTSKEEREKYERIAASATKQKVHLRDFEETFVVNCATKNAYVIRNQKMIDDSDICVFYYNENYLPPAHRQSKHAVNLHQPQSGTAVAWKYAKQRKKQVINVCVTDKALLNAIHF